MVDNQEPSNSAPSEVIVRPGDNDWLLIDLIQWANLGIELGVTLSVGGSAISGRLISGSRYFKEIASTTKRATGHVTAELIESIEGGFLAYAKLYEKPADADESWEPPLTTFVHLENARVFSPGQGPLPSSKGLLWRGKISAVDGFALGELSVS